MLPLTQLSSRTTTSYIEHSDASMRRFLEVCRSPTHAKRITEVRYLAAARTLSPEELAVDETFCHEMRLLKLSEAAEDALRAYAEQKAEEKKS